MFTPLLIIRHYIRPRAEGGSILINPGRIIMLLPVVMIHLHVFGVLVYTATFAAQAIATHSGLAGYDADIARALSDIIAVKQLPPELPSMGGLTLYFTLHPPSAVVMGAGRRAYVLHLNRAQLVTQFIVPVGATLALAATLLAAIGIAAARDLEKAIILLIPTLVATAFIDYKVSAWAAEWWDDWSDGGIGKMIKQARSRLSQAFRTATSGTRNIPEPNTPTSA